MNKLNQKSFMTFNNLLLEIKNLKYALILLIVLTLVVAEFLDRVFFGFFFGLGFSLGYINSVLVYKMIELVFFDSYFYKNILMNSLVRIFLITIIALFVVFFFKNSYGVTILFGLIVFQLFVAINIIKYITFKVKSNKLDIMSIEFKN